MRAVAAAQRADPPAHPGMAASCLRSQVVATARHRGVDMLAAVGRLAGRLDLWMVTARAFADGLPQQADTYESLLAAADHVQAARLMHHIRGMGATLGATLLADAAATAERALDPNAAGAGAAAPSATPSAAALRSVIDDTLKVFALLIEEPVAGPTAPRDAGALDRRLLALIAQLSATDMAATDAFAGLMQLHESDWQVELDPLSEAMAHLDFPGATRAAHSLRNLLALPATGHRD